MTDIHIDPDTCEGWQLLNAARIAGIRLCFVPGTPHQLIAYGAASLEGDRIKAALHTRLDELIPLLHRPEPFTISEAEQRFRTDVLAEPNVPLTELPWPVLAAMIVSLVRDTLAIERAEREWQRTSDQAVSP